MKTKTRNTLIVLIAILVFLVIIGSNAWKGTTFPSSRYGEKEQQGESLVQGGRHEKTGYGDGLIEVTLLFKGDFPSDISQQDIPQATVEFYNRSSSKAFIMLKSLVLRKYDFTVHDESRAVVCAEHEVIPHEIDTVSRHGDSLALEPGEKKKLEYKISDYFSFGPGIYDIEAVLKPGSIEVAGRTNTIPAKNRRRIEIKKGISIAGRIRKRWGEGVTGETAVWVDDEPISADEFIDTLVAVYGRTFLNRLIAEKLVWKEIEKNSIKVTHADIEYAVDIEKRIMKETLKGVPFEEYLKSRGLTEEELKESKGFILRIAIRKYISEKLALPPSEDELRTFFQNRYNWYGREEMIKARKIVVIPAKKGERVFTQKTREDAIDKLLEIKKEIEDKRVSFEEAVTLYSQDVRARVSGGEMDLFRRYSEIRDNNDVPKVVADVGFRLSPGDISTPLEIEESVFMIMQVIERLPPNKVLFKDVSQRVARDCLYDSVAGEEIQNWIQDLFEQYKDKIQYSDKFVKMFNKRLKLDKMKHYESELIKQE